MAWSTEDRVHVSDSGAEKLVIYKEHGAGDGEVILIILGPVDVLPMG